jgi:hypothetical protein
MAQGCRSTHVRFHGESQRISGRACTLANFAITTLGWPGLSRRDQSQALCFKPAERRFPDSCGQDRPGPCGKSAPRWVGNLIFTRRVLKHSIGFAPKNGHLLDCKQWTSVPMVQSGDGERKECECHPARFWSPPRSFRSQDVPSVRIMNLPRSPFRRCSGRHHQRLRSQIRCHLEEARRASIRTTE